MTTTRFTRHSLGTAVALLAAGAFALASAAPGQGGNPADRNQPQVRGDAADEVTLEGCLYLERDVPGRSPNVVERAGIFEDYLLVDARMPSAGGASGNAGQSAGENRETAGLATGRMYQVTNIDDERLQELVGQRVTVMGRVDQSTGASVGGDDLPDIEATSIARAEGTCPATPTPSVGAPGQTR